MALSISTFIYFRKTKGLFYGEVTYFVKRILSVLDGYRPYSDFESSDGPAFLYVPASVHELLVPLGITLKGSYFLVFSAATLAGLLLLAQVLNRIDIHRKQKTLLFVILALITTNETLGLAYTLLRPVLPIACLLLIDFSRTSPVPTTLSRWPVRQALFSLVTFAGVALCVLISPETGLVSFCAVCVYWGYLGFTVSPTYLLTLALCVVGFLGLTATLGPAYFQSVVSFTGGGMNFPVIPAVHVLIYLFTILYAVPLAVGAALAGQRQTGGSGARGNGGIVDGLHTRCPGKMRLWSYIHVWSSSVSADLCIPAKASKAPLYNVSSYIHIRYFNSACKPSLSVVQRRLATSALGSRRPPRWATSLGPRNPAGPRAPGAAKPQR